MVGTCSYSASSCSFGFCQPRAAPTATPKAIQTGSFVATKTAAPNATPTPIQSSAPRGFLKRLSKLYSVVTHLAGFCSLTAAAAREPLQNTVFRVLVKNIVPRCGVAGYRHSSRRLHLIWRIGEAECSQILNNGDVIAVCPVYFDQNGLQRS